VQKLLVNIDEKYTCSSEETSGSEAPEEEPIQDHCDELPIFNHLLLQKRKQT